MSSFGYDGLYSWAILMTFEDLEKSSDLSRRHFTSWLLPLREAEVLSVIDNGCVLYPVSWSSWSSQHSMSFGCKREALLFEKSVDIDSNWLVTSVLPEFSLSEAAMKHGDELSSIAAKRKTWGIEHRHCTTLDQKSEPWVWINLPGSKSLLSTERCWECSLNRQTLPFLGVKS